MAPTLTGKGHQRVREFLIHEAGNGQSIIRGDYKLIRRKDGPPELYNLVKDHGEENDISGKYPDLVAELMDLMIGERVDQPKGFANTYHHWTGSNAALVGEADNWSDYVYANEGITYTTDAGAPQLSWTARMVNSGSEPNHAVANQDLEFLALEIGGDQARQSLVLDPYIQLTGRNEIRISNGGSLTVNQGKVSSLRWIEIEEGGSLKGNGDIEGVVYNHGTLSSMNQLKLGSDFHGTKHSNLNLSLSKDTAVQVTGIADLAGELSVQLARGFKAKKGQSYSVLTAKKVKGRFSNPDGLVVSPDGSRFKIEYSPSGVTLTVL